MDFKDLIRTRRSMRKFTEEKVTEAEVKMLLRAALMSPSSKSIRNWNFVVVDDKETIKQLAHCKKMGAEFLEGAPLAIVVTANPTENDVWIEDASIASLMIQLQAEELGLGSCWAQIRNRAAEDGTPANTIVHNILGLPDSLEVLSIIGVGHKAAERKPMEDDKLLWNQVHYNKFGNTK